MPIPQSKRLLENDLRNPDVYGLKAVLHALSLFEFSDPDWQAEVKRLNDVFDNGPVPDTWKDEALGFLNGVKGTIDADLEKGEQTGKTDDPHYKEAAAFYRSYERNRSVGLVVADAMKTAALDAPKLPNGYLHNSVNDSIYGLGIGLDAVSMDPDALAPVLYAVYEQFGPLASGTHPEALSQMRELKEEYFDRRKIGYDWPAKAAKALETIGGHVMSTHTYKLTPGGGEDELFTRFLNEGKKLAAREPVTVGLPGEIDRQNEAIEQIKNIQLKMKQEHTGVHINSAKYKNMRKAVDEVCRLADTPDYDPVEMAAALVKVNEAAAVYVESKVLDKTKKTDMGIERKNTALLLMQVTDPKSVDKIVDRIEDFRLDKHNDQLTEGEGSARKKMSLKKLMDAETGRNSARAKGKLGKGIPENSNQAAIDAGVKRFKASRAAKSAQQSTPEIETPVKKNGN